MKYWKFALFAISLCFAPLLSAEDSAPKVMTSLGEVQGITENGIRIFRGIPYAEPPIGDLRWQATQPKTAWEGTLDASDYGPQCPQGFGEQTIPQDEDCLTINVWTPEVVEEPLPVMFWIHGGAHVLGNGRIQGETFARDGVVLVSINYRLGPFGVFALSEIVKNTPEGEPTGNFHLLDQIEALKWVQREIGTFGGDPGKVTIFGVSAGGSNVNLLMMSPLSNGLFHGAIAQSAGNGLSPSLDLATQSFLDDRILGALSVDDLAGLRALPWYRIIQSGPDSRGPSGPIVDSIAIKENVSQAFQAGRQHDVPYIGGANSHEGSLRVFIPIPDYDQELEANREELAPFYGLESNDPSLVVDYYGDRLFVAPT
ncbi:MAG: carboxylesterase family protein, partial [Gammaproteobacteria bacterium]|nr:carboxylesterase family protein [Gammaproteobacteria bacterium]